MSLLDRVRRVAVTGEPSKALAGGSLRFGAAMAGGSAALVSMLIIALPVLLVWVASPQSSGEWPQALSVGSSLWLLANGAQLGSGPVTISLTPWLLTAIPLVVATIAARRILMQLDDRRPPRFERWAGLRRDVGDAALPFVASYAGVGLVVGLGTASDPLHSSLVDSVVSTGLVGTLAVLVALAREFRGQVGSVAPGLTHLWTSRLPLCLRRAIQPALWGVFAIGGAGLALVLVMVVTHLARIARLYDNLGADPVGVTMLSLVHVMALPNVALWAASWIAGPGFGFGQGTSITWWESNPGLLPLIPALGAVPDPGPLPAGLWISALVPVAAGVLVGWRALRVVTRLSSWQVKARTAGSACLLAGIVLTLASAMAGGSLGADRLTALGAPSLLFGVAVLAEMLLGAVAVVGYSHLRATHLEKP